jgi:hypothetical protein
VPRYFFNLRNDLDTDDLEGQELAGLDQARSLARKYALDMTAASVLEQGKVNLHHRIEVADGAGQIVLTVEFGEVLTIES